MNYLTLLMWLAMQREIDEYHNWIQTNIGNIRHGFVLSKIKNWQRYRLETIQAWRRGMQPRRQRYDFDSIWFLISHCISLYIISYHTNHSIVFFFHSLLKMNLSPLEKLHIVCALWRTPSKCIRKCGTPVYVSINISNQIKFVTRSPKHC